MVGKNEIVAQDTKDRAIGDLVSIDVEPENIQLMKKDVTTNIYDDAWIDKNNNVVLTDTVLKCDITKLLAGSKVDDQGFLIGPDGKKYDLNDADVIAEIGLGDIELTDDVEAENVADTGTIVDVVYKGDHYQMMVRTDEEEEFIVDTLYSWNEGDIVGIIVPENAIKLTLKGDIKKYAVSE